MKQQGIFGNISNSYWDAAGAAMAYVMFEAPWLLKLPLLPVATAYGLAMSFIATLFYTLALFDILGKVADGIKKYVFNLLDSNRKLVDVDLIGFILRPLLMVFSIPILIMAVIVPRLSSSVIVEVGGEIGNVLSGSGAMSRTSRLLIETLRITWRYALRNMFQSQISVMPLIVLIALLHTTLLLPLAVFFLLLAPIDWFSALIDRSRASLARYLRSRQTCIRYSGWGFLFMPLWLIIIAPIIIILLLVPKFSAHLMVD